ncbi:hypothetical protein LCGC14_1421020 [marine sediment metagenome]|uniref:Methyltransferase type 11 domain-containing protein n=1 Tax=marine sediment metagenome TaxID=412755 RepID=A0A0F9MT29_9ZZZZ
MPKETYQDIWVKGKLVRDGKRDCENRYELIRTFCEQYTRPFTILDIGAWSCYFPIRLTEDFPDCTAVAAEFTSAPTESLQLNEPERVLWLKRELVVKDLDWLAAIEHFDVVLALSVVHQMRIGLTQSEIVERLKKLGDHLILELAVEPRSSEGIDLPQIPDEAFFGWGQKQLKRPDERRPMYLLSQPGARKERKHHLFEIESDFSSKIVTKRRHVINDIVERRPWLRGISLRTFLDLNGRWPRPGQIAEKVRSVYDPHRTHGDINVVNTIFSGDRATFIDARAPEDILPGQPPDHESLDRMLQAIKRSSAT